MNAEDVWNFLFSENGASIWLKYAGSDFSTFKTFSHIRTKWKPEEWHNAASLQMRILLNRGKTTIAFHIEKMSDEAQRTEAKAYWSKTLDDIIQALDKQTAKI